MKIQILGLEGKKEGEIETPIFDEPCREDLIQKSVEVEKKMQPYAPFYLAGKQASASGVIRHGRRKWKTACGRGISRVPRKIFWRRGTQFYWQGATVSGTKGGRRAHPPRILSMLNDKKINKKEKRKAFLSALALTASAEDIKKKYTSLEDKKIETKFPIVIDSKILNLKTKDFLKNLKIILNNLSDIAIQEKCIRPGKGKHRGRKYKKSAGLLFVVGGKENKKVNLIEIKKVPQLRISDLASNGARLTAYTEEAVKELDNKFFKKEDKIKEKK